MKKILSLAFVMLLSIFLVTGCSSKVNTSKYFEDYNTLNLDEALTQEKIDHDFDGYKETDKQATIYLFRGNGCGYCKSFLTFLNDIIDDYGKYFKVVSYETWYDENNYNLMKDVAEFLGESASGVPFIIIGDQVFPGYASRYDDQIKEAIKKLYNSEEKYDVFEEMEKEKIKENNKKTMEKVLNMVPGVAISIVGIIVILVIVNIKTKKMNLRIDKLEEQIKNAKVNEKKEEPTKKVTIKEEKPKKSSKKTTTKKVKTETKSKK